MQSKALSHLNLNCALQAAGHGVRPEELEACAHLMARAFHDDLAIRYLLEGTDLGPGGLALFFTRCCGRCMGNACCFPPRIVWKIC